MIIQMTIAFGVIVFLLGAAIGSFLNVVIWRLPHRGREVIFLEKRGRLSLSWPPSHCPVCDAPIQWYQNFPVVSWLVLRARCANCRTAIPVRYPLVELGTAILFTGFYLAYFVGHWQGGFMNPVPWLPGGSWPQFGAFVLHLTFIAALLAASAIDIDLFIIPLAIPWFLMLVGIIGSVAIDHPAIWKLSAGMGGGWWLARPIIGGTIGLIAANILLQMKVIPRSFSSEALEKEHAEAEQKRSAKAAAEKSEPMPPPPKLTRFGPSAIATVILVLLAGCSWAFLGHRSASLVTVITGLLIFLIGVLPRDAGQTDVTDEVLEEISSPFVRREVMKEVLFLLVPVACAVAAYWIPLEVPADPWVARLLGSLMGILVGGGIVWLIRIGGTLAFNKEAMGMGDAHLMAGVGAVIGAPLVIVAFLTAPFIGIGWAIVLLLMRRPNVLPYGPWLSVASILSLLLGNPLLAWYLAFL